MCQASCLCFFRGPADTEFRVTRFPRTARGDEAVHQFSVNSHCDQAVPEPAMWAERVPLAAISTGGSSSGSVYSWAFSTV